PAPPGVRVTNRCLGPAGIRRRWPDRQFAALRQRASKTQDPGPGWRSVAAGLRATRPYRRLPFGSSAQRGAGANTATADGGACLRSPPRGVILGRNSMARLRVAVVGVGHLGKEHARILAGLEDVELVSVADVNAQQARTIADRLGTEACTDFRTLLDRVDAV